MLSIKQRIKEINKKDILPTKNIFIPFCMLHLIQSQ